MIDDSSRPGFPGRRSWGWDVAAVVAAFLVGTFLSAWLQLFDRFHGWSHDQGVHGIEELAFGLLLSLAAVGALSWRRYRLARADALRLERAERELKLANERFRSLFDYHPHAVYSLDLEGRFVTANAAAQRLTGRCEEELRGLSSFGLLLAPESTADVVAAFLRALEREAVFVEGTIVHDDGSRVELAVTAMPIVVDEQVVGVYGIAEDVTGRNRLQRELARTRRSAEQASEAKSLFLTNMGHEIRTPLASIMAATELLTDDRGFDPAQRQFLDIIERNGQRVVQLVDDILDFSRIGCGEVQLEEKELDLDQLVRDCVASFRVEADRRRLALHAVTSDRLPRLLGDRARIRQVLATLIGNALKFTESGGVCVRVDVTDSDVGSPSVTFVVEDTGIGMSEEQVADLFQSFRQADASMTRRYGGTGLGLALCRQLVTLMGGAIEATGVPGVGSTFTVTLPLHHPIAADA